MLGNRGAQKYRQTAITTATRGQVLIMLYEAAIKYLHRAVACIEKKDRAGKGAAIGKTHDILMELINSLDHKIGGQVSNDLERLYNFMIEQLIKANGANDIDGIKAIIKNLDTLLGAWRVAVAQTEKGSHAK